MEIYRDIDEIKPGIAPVVTIGAFDGVHAGHMRILERIREIESSQGLESMVITFDPHPRLVLQHDNEFLRFITSRDERIERFRLAGIRHLFLMPFTRSLAAMDSGEFVRRYIHGRLGAQAVVVGYDHHFGRQAEGNFHTLEQLGKELGFAVERVEAYYIDGEPVSSSRIRECIRRGDVENARRLLGYPYFVFGTVVEGNKVGRRIGFPTANIHPDDPHKLIPSMGVYAGTALVDGHRYKGMINVGIRPTLNLDNLTIEMNLFGFEGDIYGKDIRICLRHWIREERQFSHIDALTEQLHRDRATALELLRDVDL